MEERCKRCLRICKWLDATDIPEFYSFKSLSASDVLTALEESLRAHTFQTLLLRQFARSQGNQLAMTFMPTLSGLETCSIALIAQCATTASGTELWFRFGVDDEVCEFEAVVDEFHRVLNETVNMLKERDSSSC